MVSSSFIKHVTVISILYAAIFTINHQSVNAGGALELTAKDFNKTIDSEARTLVMFYAPWCGHCQEAKPKYNKAADALAADTKKKLTLFNCDDAQNAALCTKMGIEGYPTFKLYESGKFVKDYEDEANEASIKSFLDDPVNFKGSGGADAGADQGADKEGGQASTEPDTPMLNVKYLAANNFTTFLKASPHVMVFFYAPWCPHCQDAKPKYESAATAMLAQKDKVFAAINCDAKDAKPACDAEKVEGFPTVRYFHNGEMYAEYEDEVDKESLVKFMTTPPKEKVAPTPIENEKDAGKDGEGKEAAAEGKDGEKELKDEDRKPETAAEKMEGVTYLNTETFKAFVSTPGQDTLVMFYAPWCPHCVDAKPKFAGGAAKLATSHPNKKLAAVNCDEKTSEKLCEAEKVEGFPTLAHYANGKKVSDYAEAPPTADGIVKYMSGLKSTGGSAKPKEEL